MPDSDSPRRISLGFTGGQVLPARVRPAELNRLRERLGKDGGWHELAAEGGTVVLDLTRIDYLLIEHDDHRVGF
jgi:hypothetical protein